MKTKECPSCAMEIDAGSEVCPVCRYEFPKSARTLQWVTLALVILLLIYFLFVA
jgi:RNA polymerase subunit RPABC4/transcription elongation factor Spt4